MPINTTTTAIYTQVHEDPQEAWERIMAVRIYTTHDLYRPYGLLSEGSKGRFHIARALGHYAVFDEFGSGLPLDTVKSLCIGVRKFAELRGYAEIVIVSSLDQV